MDRRGCGTSGDVTSKVACGLCSPLIFFVESLFVPDLTGRHRLGFSRIHHYETIYYTSGPLILQTSPMTAIWSHEKLLFCKDEIFLSLRVSPFAI